MTVDVYTILRVLAEGGHLAVTYPPTRAAKCKLVGPWKDHIPGPSWTASKAMVDKLDATGILDEPTMRIFEDGTRIYYFRLRGGRR
ncbi:hypothetical protein B5G43_12590 [Flavonifractor sp. An92]|uniref:hypothetical protein n=1 Tax=Flavonifractor sp. An92 TaxID=1965666 RepID=UPI000B3A1005|nr:hypothetical protein [Flavonifractor sp. An92]OUN05517.1 hypothetical protein B5G43_12590 [Flavonifractor sp. An92]